jgi:CBS domain-containing protein
MIARDLITDEIPPLKTSDSGQKALDWMEEFRVGHLPIVNKTDFLGLISEDDILNLNNPKEPLGNHSLSLFKSFVYETQHIYEIIKLMHDLKLTLVPVLDEENHYLGLITATHLMQQLAGTAAITDPGGIVVLELNEHDYSLSEIAHIVEGEDAIILSSNITSYSDSTKLELTLKINKIDLSRIIASFNRHDYVVKATYHQAEFNDNVSDRYNALMNYLSI